MPWDLSEISPIKGCGSIDFAYAICASEKLSPALQALLY